MLRTGARFLEKISGCCARTRDFLQHFQDAPRGSAIFNDEVDEDSTRAILADYRGTPLKTAMLSVEDDPERSTPVVNQYSFPRLNLSIFNDELDECWQLGHSAQDRRFERRRRPREEHRGTHSVSLSIAAV